MLHPAGHLPWLHPAAPARSAPPRARSAARRWGLLLVAGWLRQAGLRAWFGRMQVVPLANPDATAYLIAARVLAGGGPLERTLT